MSATDPSSHLALTGQQFTTLFPFHFSWDDSLQILSAGTSLQKICPDVRAGISICEVFQFIGAENEITADFLRAQTKSPFLFHHRASNLPFRGQLILLADHRHMAMLATPWLPGFPPLGGAAVSPTDFALHDCCWDLFQQLQAEQEANRELQKLVNDLSAQGTELREKETALHEINTLQRAILESARYSIISTAPDGIIRIFNSTAEQMLGYQAEEMVGIQSPAIIHDAAEVEARAAELTQELGHTVPVGFETFTAQARLGKPDEREWTYIRKDGSRFPVLLSITGLFNAEGELTGFMGIASDITERKRAAAELLAAKEEAEAANRAKSDFLATMSHEIRTPMNGMIGMTSLLLESKLSPSQREMAEAVRNSGEALMTIIEDILDFSKIEARRLDLVEEIFSLDSVIDGVVDLLYHKIQAKSLEMSVVIDADVPANLRGDPGRVRQIMLNLVGNAIKFTDEGEVNLFVRLDANKEEKDAQGIEIIVTDTGIGMTSEQQRQLFNPFTQVDGSSIRRYGGTGLGLVITKRLVERMGGEITLQSSRHRGSTFVVRLPLRAVPQRQDKVSWPREVSGYHILIADDIALSLKAAELALDGLPNNPRMVESEAALASLLRDRDQLWDVLVVDRRLYGTRTLEILNILEQENRKPKIIVLGQLTDSSRERTEQGKVDFFLTKPLRRQQLRSAICKLAQPEAALSPQEEETAVVAGEEKPRLLIVEDNEVNSRLALLLLEKLGYAPDVVRDGAEALRYFSTGLYDGLLMDCHMPVMDGYEATRRIRELEISKGWTRPRARIIAMTANAMAGERERCLEAGMDDYLSKPLRTASLKQALTQVEVLHGFSSESSILPRDISEDEQEPLHSIRQLAEELSDEAAAQLIQSWLNDTPSRLGEIAALADSEEQASLKRLVHSLKGSSALFGLTRIHDLSRKLEHLAETEEIGGQALLADELRLAFETLVPSLKEELGRLTKR